jgi:hypothetical protein
MTSKLSVRQASGSGEPVGAAAATSRSKPKAAAITLAPLRRTAAHLVVFSGALRGLRPSQFLRFSLRHTHSVI